MIAFKDRPVQLEALIRRCTDRMASVTVPHEPRYAGETKYDLHRQLRFAVDLLRGWRAVRRDTGDSEPQYLVVECLGFSDDLGVSRG
jgi:hypothetical protein